MMTWLIYALAALAEIAGCFAFWAWLRLDRSFLWLVPGMGSLAAFAFLLTRIDSEAAGRAYAAYGGVYIAASILWLWLVEQRAPDRWDLTGAAICLAGAAVILVGRPANSTDSTSRNPVSDEAVRSVVARQHKRVNTIPPPQPPSGPDECGGEEQSRREHRPLTRMARSTAAAFGGRPVSDARGRPA